jgi:hypothetical protein
MRKKIGIPVGALAVVLALGSLVFPGCARRTVQTVETEEDPIYTGGSVEGREDQPRTVRTRTETRTETTPGVLAGIVNGIGEVLAFPFQAIANVIRFIF